MSTETAVILVLLLMVIVLPMIAYRITPAQLARIIGRVLVPDEQKYICYRCKCTANYLTKGGICQDCAWSEIDSAEGNRQ